MIIGSGPGMPPTAFSISSQGSLYDTNSWKTEIANWVCSCDGISKYRELAAICQNVERYIGLAIYFTAAPPRVTELCEQTMLYKGGISERASSFTVTSSESENNDGSHGVRWLEGTVDGLSGKVGTTTDIQLRRIPSAVACLVIWLACVLRPALAESANKLSSDSDARYIASTQPQSRKLIRAITADALRKYIRRAYGKWNNFGLADGPGVRDFRRLLCTSIQMLPTYKLIKQTQAGLGTFNNAAFKQAGHTSDTFHRRYNVAKMTSPGHATMDRCMLAAQDLLSKEWIREMGLHDMLPRVKAVDVKHAASEAKS